MASRRAFCPTLEGARLEPKIVLSNVGPIIPVAAPIIGNNYQRIAIAGLSIAPTPTPGVYLASIVTMGRGSNPQGSIASLAVQVNVYDASGHLVISETSAFNVKANAGVPLATDGLVNLNFLRTGSYSLQLQAWDGGTTGSPVVSSPMIGVIVPLPGSTGGGLVFNVSPFSNSQTS
jgi:hypothetical protein